MEALESKRKRRESASGVIYAGAAFLIWGVGPIYWKALAAVPPLEIILHRVVWAFIFLLVLILLGRRWDELFRALKDLKILLMLSTTAVILGLNWWLYVWAINNNFVLQGSLGYYINPLVNVVFGVVFLKERLRPKTIPIQETDNWCQGSGIKQRNRHLLTFRTCQMSPNERIQLLQNH